MQHLDTVHGNKRKSKCEMCPKTYKQIGCLNRHLQAIHGKITAFKCDICGKSFKQKGSLKVHLKVVHENQEGNTFQ